MNQPLFNANAIEKIKEMTGEDKTVMFCCNLQSQPFDATPMSTQGVDDNGAIWFFSAKDSDRNKYISQDARTQILYSNMGSFDFLSLYGKSEIVDNPAKVRDLWSPHVKAWFPDGPEDSNLSLVKFTPTEGYYWDTKSGKAVSLLKMAASMVTGNKVDEGVGGKLKP